MKSFTWTIAYRMSKNANHFKRVTNWSGTWNQARILAAEFEAYNPGAEVWYVPTREVEESEALSIKSGETTDFGQSADWGNILVESGKRIQMRDTGLVTEDMIESVKVQAWTMNERDAMNRAATENAIDTNTRFNNGVALFEVAQDELNNVDRFADIRGDDAPESRGWRVVGAVRNVGSEVSNHYVVKWWGNANRGVTLRIVHRSKLTNLY